MANAYTVNTAVAIILLVGGGWFLLKDIFRLRSYAAYMQHMSGMLDRESGTDTVGDDSPLYSQPRSNIEEPLTQEEIALSKELNLTASDLEFLRRMSKKVEDPETLRRMVVALKESQRAGAAAES